MSLHINNQFAKMRGIGKKLLLAVRTVMMEEHVDFVAGDFNGAAWRRPCGSDRRLTSIIEEASADTNLQVPPGPTPLRRPGGVPGEWADVCGFIKPTESHDECQVCLYGAFSIPDNALGLREKDQSCHHEVWMHLAHAKPWGNRAAQYKPARQVHLKERASPYDHSTQRRRAHRDQRDHSRDT